MATKRLQRELHRLQTDHPTYASVNLLDPNNCYEWIGTIMGPENTPYYGGIFPFKMQFPVDYPFLPPKVNLQVPIYHPNISYDDGFVCLEYLSSKWSPMISILQILDMIRNIMEDPDPDNTLFYSDQNEIASICKKDPKKFNQTAREWTQRYAMLYSQEGAY